MTPARLARSVLVAVNLELAAKKAWTEFPVLRENLANLDSMDQSVLAVPAACLVFPDLLAFPVCPVTPRRVIEAKTAILDTWVSLEALVSLANLDDQVNLASPVRTFMDPLAWTVLLVEMVSLASLASPEIPDRLV